MKNRFVFVLLGLALAGCGGSYTVTRFDGAAPGQLRSVAVSPREGNSPEVTSYVSDALVSQGVAVTARLPAGVIKTDKADAVVSYLDVWRWDMAMYLDSISIDLYNASTGELLVTGRWRDSFFHAFHRGESISKELIDQMMAKLGLKPVSAKETMK
jgi:hypothetical protein